MSGSLPENLSGRKFGRLTALKIARHLPIFWECSCECGHIVEVDTRNLKSGNTKSCGCLQKERVSKTHSLRPFEAVYNALKKNAARRRKTVVVVLTYEEFIEFTEIKECHYCSEKIVWSRHKSKGRGLATNLDRKDSNIGYTKENVVVCCKRCNRGKSDHFTYEEWVEVGKCLRILKLKAQGRGASNG